MHWPVQFVHEWMQACIVGYSRWWQTLGPSPFAVVTPLFSFSHFSNLFLSLITAPATSLHHALFRMEHWASSKAVAVHSFCFTSFLIIRIICWIAWRMLSQQVSCCPLWWWVLLHHAVIIFLGISSSFIFDTFWWIRVCSVWWSCKLWGCSWIWMSLSSFKMLCSHMSTIGICRMWQIFEWWWKAQSFSQFLSGSEQDLHPQSTVLSGMASYIQYLFSGSVGFLDILLLRFNCWFLLLRLLMCIPEWKK